MTGNLNEPWKEAEFLSSHEHAARFFRVSFCADWLENQSSLEDAVADYCGDARGASLEDTDGKRLLAEVSDMQGRHLTEEQLTHLIEQEWRTQGDSGEPWGSYGVVLDELANLLQRSTI